ncbi:hypothetical protein Tco_1518605 [Tanacetum coccineum]
MVAYLKKPTGSEGFQEILDFLNGSHIRYALTTNHTIYVSLIKNFWQTATVKTFDNREQETTATINGKEFTVTKASVRRHLQLANVEDDRVGRATTTAASLDAAQASGNITKTQSTAISNDLFSQEIGLGDRPRCQESIGGVIAQTRSERASKLSYDSPTQERLHTGSDRGRLKQDKLTDIVTALSQKVEGLKYDLKKTKKLYATAFKKLINMVKSLEDELKFQNSKSKRRRLTLVTSKDEDDLVNLETQEGFGAGPEVTTADTELNTASTFVSIASPQRHADITADDLTLAETLMEIRKSATKDKGKAKIDEIESPRKMKQREWV